MSFCEKTKTWTTLMLQDDGTYANWCQGCRDWHKTDKTLWLKEENHEAPNLQNIFCKKREGS